MAALLLCLVIYVTLAYIHIYTTRDLFYRSFPYNPSGCTHHRSVVIPSTSTGPKTLAGTRDIFQLTRACVGSAEIMLRTFRSWRIVVDARFLGNAPWNSSRSPIWTCQYFCWFFLVLKEKKHISVESRPRHFPNAALSETVKFLITLTSINFRGGRIKPYDGVHSPQTLFVNVGFEITS